MDYGKQNLNKRKKNISSKKAMKKKRVGVRLFKALLICILLVAIVGISVVGLFAKRIIDNTPTVTPADVKPSGFTSFVYSEDGALLEKFVESGSNRVYRSIDEIPQDLADAFVAIEDERFYDHNGIDLKGIIRAAVVGVTNGFHFSEGASTITQQLIKNNVFPDFVNEETLTDRLERKLQEQVLAVQIEQQMEKEDILESYMNTINLGQNCLGVQAASKRYFGKDVSDLTLSECAVIAGITQNPSGYDPVVYPEENDKRRTKVLNNMLEQEYITQEEYDTAIADNVYERVVQAAPEEDSSAYSYFNDALIEQVINDLQTKKGYSETQAYNALYSGGLTIISTQDTTIQQICDEEVANESVYPSTTEYGLEYALTVTKADGTVTNYSKEMLASYISSAWGRETSVALLFSSPDQANQAIAEYKSTLGITEEDTVDERITINPQPQTSVVIIEQSTGKVKAMVGGRGEKTSSLSLNRATDSPRQPGSCFKIVSTYAPAIDACEYTLASSLNDSGPFQYPNSTKKAANWDGIYLGSARLRYAIEHSMNVCALNTFQDITPELGYEYLLNFGFTTLVDGTDEDFPGYSDIQLATALGGITRGVYNIEMTAAYATIANGGTYIEPTYYTQVLDHDGNILLDNTHPDSHRVIKETTAALLTSAMEDVINKGTGTAARLNNMAAAGKTGTTENSVDLWLAAFTPYYTCSVWGGYDQNKSMSSMNQAWHEILWKNIMDRVHENLAYKSFEMPDSIEKKTICSKTGMLASTEFCSGITEYFAEGSYKAQPCSGHADEIKAKEEEEKKKEEEENKPDNDTTNGDTTGSDTTGGDTTGGDTTGGNTTGGNTTGGNSSSSSTTTTP